MTGEPRYQRIVEDTIGYVLRDLRHEAGGFFCAEDADSEGVEGKFYVWALDELEAVCGDDAAEVVRYFGATNTGNFVDPHTGFSGNILHVVSPTEIRPEAVERALPKLFAHREHRVRPGLDDKVLLAWNALFVRALAEAASVFERGDWMGAARANTRFLLASMRRDDGRLLRSWQDGRAGILAYAEDYAALLEALLTLAEVDDVSWLRDARTVADELLRLFADTERGGVFTTGTDAEQLIVRPKDIQDNATPCENSLAANGLLRLAALTGVREYEDAALGWVQPMGEIAAEHPTAFAYLLGAVDRAVRPPLEVAVIGAPDDPNTDALWRVVTQRVMPGAVTLRAAPGEGADLSPLLADRPLVDGRATAYVCERYACRQPVTDADALAAQLDDVLKGRGVT